MQNNNQRASAARHGRNVPHDEKQATLTQGVAKHENNEASATSKAFSDDEDSLNTEKNFSLYGEFYDIEFCLDDSAQQQTEKEGSDDGDFNNSKDTFVVNLFEHSNDGKDSARESEVKKNDSEDEKTIINNLAKRYGEDNIFDNSDEEATTGSFCYEDGPICPY